MAPKADSFKIAGALIPQWVISNGPSLHKWVPRILTVTSSATTPGMSFRRSSFILKVKREGTGLEMVCPRPFRSVHILVLLPVAITTFFAENAP